MGVRGVLRWAVWCAVVTLARHTPAWGEPSAPPTFTVLYTSNRLGELNPCGCANHPMGGLARQVLTLANAKHAGPTLALDGGDALLKDVPIPGVLRQQYNAKAHVVAAGFGSMLDAYVPGELDVGDNAAWFLDLVQRYKMPAVAANLVDRDGRAVFAPYVERHLGGVRILVVGVTDPALWPRGLSVRATPAVQALKDVMQRAPPYDFAVLLSHASWETSAEYARALGVFSLVGVGHGGALFFHPKTIPMPAGAVVSLALALSTGKTVKHVGELAVTVKRGEALLRGGEDYGKLTVALENARVRLKTNPSDAVAQAALDQAAQQLQEERRHSHADFALITLGVELPEDPTVATWVTQYNERNTQRELALWGMTAPAQDLPAASPYAGGSACVKCHEQAQTVWLSSKHARALNTLQEKHQSLDRECIGCHSMGYQQRGGFKDPAAVAGFGDVQCEACHGPGKVHVESGGGSGNIQRGAGLALCVRCHTADNAPQFNWKRDREIIRHWKAP